MKCISVIKKLRLEALIHFFRCLPIKKRKIIFWSDNFKSYGDSPKYLTDYIIKHKAAKYDIVWVFNSDFVLPSDFPREVRVVRYFSIQYLKEIHTAHYVICNTRMGDAQMWNKRKGQRYIQTWHSSIRLKKIEQDAAETLPFEYIENAKKDSAKTDLIISGCGFSTKIFRESFWYSGKILNSGTPRCDIFFHKDNLQEKIRKKLNLPHKHLVILYAPTFRNSNFSDLHGLEISRLKNKIKDVTGVECVFLYRFHPNVIATQPPFGDGIDVTKYPDMQELITASDILITDYSSCMFDMAIAGKVCILYAPDIESYLSVERGLYFDIKSLPFPVATDNRQLMDILSSFDVNEYNEKVGLFLKAVNSYEDGNACEKIITYIEESL